MGLRGTQAEGGGFQDQESGQLSGHEHMLRVYSRTELECSRLADGFANVTL